MSTLSSSTLTQFQKLLQAEVPRVLEEHKLISYLTRIFTCKENETEVAKHAIARALYNSTIGLYRKECIQPAVHISFHSSYYQLTFYTTPTGIEFPNRLPQELTPHIAKLLCNMKSLEPEDIHRGMIMATFVHSCKCSECASSSFITPCIKSQIYEEVEKTKDLFDKTILTWVSNNLNANLDKVWYQVAKQIKSHHREELSKTKTPRALMERIVEINHSTTPYKMLQLHRLIHDIFQNKKQSSSTTVLMDIVNMKVDELRALKPLNTMPYDMFCTIQEWLRTKLLSDEEQEKQRIEREQEKQRLKAEMEENRLRAETAFREYERYVDVSQVRVDLVCRLEADASEDPQELLKELECELPVGPTLEHLLLPQREAYHEAHAKYLLWKKTLEQATTLKVLRDHLHNNYTQRAQTILQNNRYSEEVYDHCDTLINDMKSEHIPKEEASLQKQYTDLETSLIKHMETLREQHEKVALLERLFDGTCSEYERKAADSGILQWMLYGGDSDPKEQVKSYLEAVNVPIKKRYEAAVQSLTAALQHWCPHLTQTKTTASAFVLNALACESPTMYEYFKDSTTVATILANHCGMCKETNGSRLCWHCCSLFTPPDHVAPHMAERYAVNMFATHLLEIGSIRQPQKIIHKELNGDSYMLKNTCLYKGDKEMHNCGHIYDMLAARKKMATDMSLAVDRVHPLMYSIMNCYS